MCGAGRLGQEPVQPRVVGHLDRELERLEPRAAGRTAPRPGGRRCRCGATPGGSRRGRLTPAPGSSGCVPRRCRSPPPPRRRTRSPPRPRPAGRARRCRPFRRHARAHGPPASGSLSSAASVASGMTSGENHSHASPIEPDRRPVPADVRPRDATKDEVRPVRLGPRRRRRDHLQIGDDIGDLARRQVGIAVEADLKGFHRSCLARPCRRWDVFHFKGLRPTRELRDLPFAVRIAPTVRPGPPADPDGTERPGPEPRSCPKPCWSWKTTSST